MTVENEQNFAADAQEVRSDIRRAALRKRAVNLALAAGALAPAILALAIVEVLARRLGRLDAGQSILVSLAFGLLAIAWLAFATLRGTRPGRIALEVDRIAGFKDRISSALEFSSVERPSEMQEAQVRDSRRIATSLDPKSVFPFDRRGILMRLAPVLLLVPLLYLVGIANLSFMHRVAKPGSPIAQQGEIPQAEPSLQEAVADKAVLELVRPAEEIIRQWKERLQSLNLQQAAGPQPGQSQEQQATGPRVEGSESVKPGGPPKEGPDLKSYKIRLADLKTLADRELDGDYKEAFEYLDNKVFKDGAGVMDVAELAKKMQKQGQDQMQGGQGTSFDSQFAGGMGQNQGAKTNREGAFKNQAQGAQQQSYADFVSEYASHLAKIAGKMTDLIKEAMGKPEAQDKPKEIVPGELPPDGKYQLAEGNKPQGPAGLQVFVDKPPEGAQLTAGLPSTSQAGHGAGTPEGLFKTPKVQEKASEFVEVDSRLGEGVSPIQVIEDFSQKAGRTQGFGAVYRNYAMEAEKLMGEENLPAAVENYIRAYFLSISPQSVQAPPPSTQQAAPSGGN